MRLRHNTVAAQEVPFGAEGEAIDLSVQAPQLHTHLRRRGWHRFVVLEQVHMKLRWDAFLENLQLQGKIAVAQHSPAMRAALVFSTLRLRALLLGSFSSFTPVACTHHEQA